jgi:hypothetical protein
LVVVVGRCGATADNMAEIFELASFISQLSKNKFKALKVSDLWRGLV